MNKREYQSYYMGLLRRRRGLARGGSAHRDRYEAVNQEIEDFVRSVTTVLPFRWVVAHAYTLHETATYGGGDHIQLLEPISIGRLRRKAGDALGHSSATRFRDLFALEDRELPNCAQCIAQAAVIAADVVRSKG